MKRATNVFGNSPFPQRRAPARKQPATRDAAPPAPEEQLTALQQKFRESRAQERKRFLKTTDSEYWFCVCFRSREQKDAFLKATGWKIGRDDKYIDGTKIAALLKIPLPDDAIRYAKRPSDRSLLAGGLIEPLPRPKV